MHALAYVQRLKIEKCYIIFVMAHVLVLKSEPTTTSRLFDKLLTSV